LLVLSQFRLVNAKYLIPVIPFWYLLASAVIVSLFGKLQKIGLRKTPALFQGILLSVLILLMGVPNLNEINHYCRIQAQQDTRTEARQFLGHYIRQNVAIVTEPETVPLATLSPERIEGLLLGFSPKTQDFYIRRSLSISRDMLEQDKPEYILIQLKPLRDPRNKQPVLRYPLTYYQYLFNHYQVVTVFNPYRRDLKIATMNLATDYRELYRHISNKDRVRLGPLMVLYKKRV
jgi:hypothetical protein